jgi:phosphate-selective porin OprO/OprP
MIGQLKRNKCFSFYLILLFLLTGNSYAFDDGTSKEKDLLKVIEELQRRTDELEREINELKSQEDPSEVIENRIIELEKDMEYQKQPENFRVYWKDGPRFETAQKNFKFGLTGQILNDWGTLSGDDDIEDQFGDLEDGTLFRSARLGVTGLIYDRIELKAVYDYTEGNSDFVDVYMGIIDIPIVGNIRVGHFFEPFGLEQLTSINHLSFMERALTGTFTPVRNTGLMLHNHVLNDRVTWAAGVFRESDNFGDGSGDGDYNVTGRLTGLPWYENKGEKLVHLGAAFSHKSPVNETFRWHQRPESFLAPFFVDTQPMPVDHVYLTGTEAALIYKSLSLQGEWVHTIQDVRLRAFERENDLPQSREDDDIDFNAYYVYLSYLLTGEHREYNTSSGVMKTVRPIRNFYDKQRGFGTGAWELLFRYSGVDLDDKEISGGELNDFTLGLNWYLNPNTRIMVNYVRADLEQDDNEFGDGDADIVQMRFHIFW